MLALTHLHLSSSLPAPVVSGTVVSETVVSGTVVSETVVSGTLCQGQLCQGQLSLGWVGLLGYCLRQQQTSIIHQRGDSITRSEVRIYLAFYSSPHWQRDMLCYLGLKDTQRSGFNVTKFHDTLPWMRRPLHVENFPEDMSRSKESCLL